MKNVIERMKKDIVDQDNRMTEHPIYQVILPLNTGSRVMQSFFTQAGADDFISNNEHNYDGMYVYIASGHNNPEWKAIRKLLIGDYRDN